LSKLWPRREDAKLHNFKNVIKIFENPNLCLRTENRIVKTIAENGIEYL
jgi:hypothetical protein